MERTSFAEKGEDKGFLVVEFLGGQRGRARFIHLQARRMVELSHEDDSRLWAALGALPADAVVRIRCSGEAQAARLSLRRAQVPASMNVELRLPAQCPA